MNFAMLGGDDRSVRLCRLLRADGHAVRPYALEKELSDCAPTPAEALAGAQAVILPLPCAKEGLLNAPLSEKTHPMDQLLEKIPPRTPVYAGKAGEIAAECARLGLPLHDYFAREELTVRNAALTAEGALEWMLRESDRALLGSRVMLCGFGRIGRQLAPRLQAMGARVHVLARSAADRAWAESMGCAAWDLGQLPGPGRYDFVVNTIPAPLFGREELAFFGGALLLELASPPYGFDAGAARELGLRRLLAAGLPGLTAPESAAEAVRDAIYHCMEESS